MIVALCVTFTSLPAMGGFLDVHAATNKITVTATCNGWTNTVALRWNRISNPQQGYAVIVNGKVWKHVGKWTNYYVVKGLKSDTKYTFRVRTWKKVRSKMWYNTATKKWQWTDPGWRYRGRTNYGMRIVYGTCSPAVYKSTAKVKYTIKYDANGGTGAPANGVKLQNTAFKVSTQRPKKACYRFTGWTIVETGYKNLQPGGTITAGSNRSYTLKAQWVRVYTIRYDANGGTGAPATGGKAHNSVYKVPTTVPTRDGYKFTGWTIVETGYKSLQPGGTISADSNANYTLKAQWEAASEYCVIGFNDYDGTRLYTAAVKYGELPVYQGRNPQRASDSKYYYTFNGWNPKIVEASDDAVYTATYTATLKDSTIYSGGGNTPSVDKKTVTNYLGVTRTIEWDNEYGCYVDWDEGILCKPIQAYDKTVDGEFKDSKGIWIQKNGVTFNKADLTNQTQATEAGGSLEYFKVEMYNGDADKLSLEVANPVETISTHDYYKEPKTYKFIMKDGYRLVRVADVVTEKKSASRILKKLYISRLEDDLVGCGFASGNINIRIKYDGQQIGSITYNPNPYGTEMYPTRENYLNIAKAAVDANGGPKSYDEDMNAIEKYVFDNYTYNNIHCGGGALILESWSIYQYNVYGFLGPGYSTPDRENWESHAAFHLDSDPTCFYQTQGHK